MDQSTESKVWHMLDELNRLESEKYVKTIQGKSVTKSLVERIDKQREDIFGILKESLLEWIPKKTWSTSMQGFAITFGDVQDAPFQVDFISKMADRGKTRNEGMEIIPGVSVVLHPYSAVIQINQRQVKITKISEAGKRRLLTELKSKNGKTLKLTVFG